MPSRDHKKFNFLQYESDTVVHPNLFMTRPKKLPLQDVIANLMPCSTWPLQHGMKSTVNSPEIYASTMAVTVISKTHLECKNVPSPLSKATIGVDTGMV